MSKIAMISAFLVSVGFGVEAAVTEAEALEKKIPGAKGATRKGGVDAFPTKTVGERIIGYARSRNGNVFSLASLSLALPGVGRNYLSTHLTTFVRKGVFNRTGRGEYLLTDRLLKK